MDRGLAFHRAIAQLMGEMVRALSEAVVLPFDIEFYALFLKSALSRLEMRYKHLLESNGASFGNDSLISRFFSLMIYLIFSIH